MTIPYTCMVQVFTKRCTSLGFSGQGEDYYEMLRSTDKNRSIYQSQGLIGLELEAFLEHVESCRDCYDELETYYIISVGMRYLEEENLESYNIPKMLQEDIHTRKQQVKRRNIFRKSAVFLGVLFIIAALILLLSYLGHLELPELF